MTAPGLRNLRRQAERDDRYRRDLLLLKLDGLLHDYCSRPHEVCVCSGNPRAGVVPELPPEGARLRALHLEPGRAA